MLVQLFALLLSPFLGGLGLLVSPKLRPSTFRFILVFAGSYLFAITIIHLLPDLVTFRSLNKYIGFYILIGFFLQLGLGFFSKGIEHGHTYPADHSKLNIAPLTLLLSLSVHAFLDGVIFSNTMSGHFHPHTINSLLIGIVLHKSSEAFALVSILKKLVLKKSTIIGYLILFSLASPLGLIMSRYSSQQLLLSDSVFLALSAIAVGNFLHIATTIFFEHSINHRIDARTLAAMLLGCSLVMLLEYGL
jgi:zinc and cadmium transporter